jgi:outer membrane receptor for ferrienterochelin and colicins
MFPCEDRMSRLKVQRFNHGWYRSPRPDERAEECAPARAPGDPLGGDKLITFIPPRSFMRRMIRPALRLLCLSLLCTFTARCLLAQDAPPSPNLIGMSIEDLLEIDVDSVYGASGYKQKVTEAPASITIITSDDIRKYGYRTLAEILQSVPGFYVSYDRNYSYLGIRGFGRPGDYNSRVLLLVDGHRSNDNIYEQALIGTEFPIDVDLIDRVEVIRGPNSSLYVASAFLGVINVITKRARNASNLTASGELASYGTFKTHVSYGNRFRNGLEMLLSSSFYDSQGHQRLYFPEFDAPGTNHGIAHDVDGDQYRQVFANLSFHGLALQGVYGWRKKVIPTASFGTIFNDPGSRTIDVRGYLDLKYDHKFGSDWGYRARLYYDQYSYDGSYPYDKSQSGGPSRVVNRDLGAGQWWGAEFDVSKKLWDKQTLIVGTEYRDNFQQDQENYDLQPFFQYLNDRRTSSIWAVYAQDSIPLRSNLVLDLGLRYDHYSTFGGTTNPRAALIYSPFAKTTLKLLYGQAFRAPNAYELYDYGAGSEPNPHLKPETVRTTELVLEQSLQHNFHLTASGYFYPIRGLISQQEDPSTGLIVYRNSERVNMQGLELALKKKLPFGLEAGGSFSLQTAKEGSTGSPLPNSPHGLAHANLSVPLLHKQLFASMNLTYVSRRRTVEGNYAGAYVVPSLTLFSRKAARGWEVSVSIYNIFDQSYGDPAGEEHRQAVIYQDGRNFRVKVGYHF